MKSFAMLLFLGALLNQAYASTSGVEALGIGLNAPVYPDHTNATLTSQAALGDIVYDVSTNSFWGRAQGTGGWVALSAPGGGSLSTQGGTAEVVLRADVTFSSSCPVSNATGSWIATGGTFVNQAGGGLGCSISIASGTFTTTPTCMLTPRDATAGGTTLISAYYTATSTNLHIYMNYSSGGATVQYDAATVSVICMGH